MTLASTIARLRRERGLTLNQLAASLLVSTSFICDVEHGRRGVSVKTAVGLAKALQVDPAELVRMVLQERLDAAGVALTVLVQPSRRCARSELGARLASEELDQAAWNIDPRTLFQDS